MSTLAPEPLKDVIKELFKSKEENNYEPIEKIIASGKEGLQAFLDVMEEEVQSATIYYSHLKKVTFGFKNGGELRASDFPLDFWKQIVPHVRDLKISNTNVDMDTPLIEALQYATNLSTIETWSDFGEKMWQNLATPSLKSISAPLDVLAVVNGLQNFDANLDFVETLYRDDGSNRNNLMKLLLSFRLHCKALKISWFGRLQSLGEILFFFRDKKALSNAVEHIEFVLNECPDYPYSEPVFTGIVEFALPAMFPNLKKTTIMLTTRAEDLSEVQKKQHPMLHGLEALYNGVLWELGCFIGSLVVTRVNFEFNIIYKVLFPIPKGFQQALDGYNLVEPSEFPGMKTFEKKITNKKTLKFVYKEMEKDMNVEFV